MENKFWYRDVGIIKAVLAGHNSITELSNFKNLSKSTVKQAVDRLIKYGFLTREPGNYTLTVTANGKKVANKIESQPVAVPPEDLGYRIVNKNGKTYIYPVFHGTVPPGFKID